jgi:polyisoprenoid-binding protein YceI
MQLLGTGFLVTLIAAATLSLLPTGTFALDPAASRVEFFVNDNRGGFTGYEPTLEATAVVHERDWTFDADVEVRIDARKITTNSSVRDGQMHRDFLETARFPTITLVGSARLVDTPRAGPFDAILRGRLTIKDQTREVEVPLRVIALRDVYLIEGKATIRLSDFRIPIPRFLFFVAEDPVNVTLKVRLLAR